MPICRQATTQAAVLRIVGIAFLAIGIAGQDAFFGVGAALFALGWVASRRGGKVREP